MSTRSELVVGIVTDTMFGDILPDDVWPAGQAPSDQDAEQMARQMFDYRGVRYAHTSERQKTCPYDFILFVNGQEYMVDVKGSTNFVGRVLVDQFTLERSGYFERRACIRHNFLILLNNNVIVTLEDAYRAKKAKEVNCRQKMTWAIDYRDFEPAGVRVRSFNDWLEEVSRGDGC